MKIGIFLMCISIGVASASTTYSQNTMFSLHVNNKTLKDVFSEIEKQSEYIFFYNDEAVNIDRKVNLKVDNATIDEILNEILDKSNSGYKVLDRQVILFKNFDRIEKNHEVETTDQVRFAVTGSVKTENGEELIGVSIVEKGTPNGVITDINGDYKIDVANDNASLIFSYIGFKTQEIVLGGKNQINVVMQEDMASIDEIIVVGYSSQRRESLTGSMQNIKAEKLKDITTPSVENMLNGKVSGVYVAPGSGQPGSNGAVVIRGQATLSGTTSPLWVIDGVIVGSDAGQLNPNDIESMTVLKDAASTAIYGSQGANGVIVVTTKNGRSGKMSINISAKAGVSTLNNGNLKMMNGAELYDYYASYTNANEISFTRWNSDLRNSNFDWWDLATQSGFNQDYNLSIQGGNETVQSFLSLNFYDEEGAIKGYDYQRYNFRFKTSYKPYSWLTIKPAISGSLRDITNQQYSVTAMYSMLPWDSPYDENGDLVPHRYSDWVNSQQTNYLYDLQWNYTESKYYEFMGNFDFDIRLTDWLTFSSVNNYKYINSTSHTYYDPRSNTGLSVNGRLTEWRAEVARRYTNQILRFTKAFGKHSVNGLIAYEFNDYWYKNLDAYGTGFVPGFEILDVVAQPERTKGNIQEWAVQSYLFNANYSYDNKYLAQLSFRRDGASNFGDNAKYGNFFSISAGWNIIHENWFTIQQFDALKLRAAYGSVGNRPSSLYPQYDLYSVSASYDGESGALINQIGNKDLTWEKTYTFGIGLDASLFNERLRFTFDYYSKITENILYRVPITGITGVTSIWRNIGEMNNTGYEISIGGDIIRNKDLNWGIDLNVGHNSNELKDLYKQKESDGSYIVKPVIISDGTNIAGTAQRILDIGKPIDTYYLKEWAGVNPENGAPMWYMDGENGVKETTSDYSKASYYQCGSASPKLFGGFSTSLTWKNFDLSAVFGYSIGGKIYNYSRQEYDADGTYSDRNQMKLYKSWSRWEKPGDIATHPVAKYNNQDKGNSPSSRYLEDNDFLKMRSLTLGYNFKIPQYGVNNLRLFFNAENLFTITDYSGVDPEIPANEGSIMNTAGASVYPSVRKFMFGVNLTF